MKNEIIEKIFAHPDMRKVPAGAQSPAIKAFTEILEDIMEVKPDAAIYELFSTYDESISE